MKYVHEDPNPTWEFLEAVYKDSIRLEADSTPEAAQEIQMSTLATKIFEAASHIWL